MHSVPHATCGDYHSFHPVQHFNSQPSGLSILSLEIVAQAPPIHGPDVFSETAFDPTLHHIYGNGMYDYDTQMLSPQTPPLFMQNHSYPFSNASPLGQNNVTAFTFAYSMLSSLDVHDTAFPPFSSTDFASTSNYPNQHLLSSMLTPSQLFASNYEDLDFGLMSSCLP